MQDKMLSTRLHSFKDFPANSKIIELGYKVKALRALMQHLLLKGQVRFLKIKFSINICAKTFNFYIYNQSLYSFFVPI